VKGPNSFSQIRTISGHEYPTFCAACEALGLLGDVQEWHNALKDAAQWAMPFQLWQLFVTILLFCKIANPSKLFDEYIQKMSEDATYRLNHKHTQLNNPLADCMLHLIF
jgi:hypothetical protein